MRIENEDRFLVNYFPAVMHKCQPIEIVQGYLIVGDGRQARIRMENNKKCILTFKAGSGQKRNEENIKITKGQFQQMWPLTKGMRISKTRYPIRYQKWIIELDIFHGSLKGYFHAEVEFKGKRGVKGFISPDWLGKKVTDDPRHDNINLAKYGIPKDDTSVPINSGEGEKIVISPETKKQVADVIAEMEATGRTKERVCVLVSAGSGAGKGVLTNEIKKHFGKLAVELPLDDYYRGISFMEKEKKKGNILTWDEPGAVALSSAARHIIYLLGGTSVKKPTYSFETGRRGKAETVYPAKYVVVEGNFAFAEMLMPYGDIKAFIDVGVHGRMLRRLIRDVSLQRTKWKPADVMEYFLGVAQPMHEKYIESQKMKADFIITNEYNPEVEAPKAGMSETQIKFPKLVDSELLRKAGAVWIASIEQVDRYYSPRDRNILKNGEALRIRQEGRNFILIYKGPECKGSKLCNRPTIPPFRINEETVGHFVEIFGEELLEIRKNRTIFLLDGVAVCRDGGVTQYWHAGGRILTLGDFTEIRCAETTGKHNCEKIALVAEKLGLDLDKGIKTPYAQM